MKRKTSLTIGVILLVIAILFIIVAAGHPELSFPWSLRVTFMFYGFYTWLLFRFLLVIPVFHRMEGASKSGSMIRAIIFLLMAITFFAMEVTGDTVDVFTIMRGFIVTGAIDTFLENIILYTKGRKKYA